MQTLGLEGAKNNIRVNCLSPAAGTRMLEGLMPQNVIDLLEPEAVSPAVLALVADEAPNRVVLCAGAGSFEQARIGMTERSEEHTSELQSLMRISYAVFCLKKKNTHNHITTPQ